MSDQNTEISELKAECAALRATVALLITGMFGNHDFGSAANWRDGTMADLAATISGLDKLANPHFAPAMQKIAALIFTTQGALRADAA
jgi:hypothetical protein